MTKIKYYIESFRLRTLPLSVSGIILGGMLAYAAGSFNTTVFSLALITTLCLQILSNIANELGDTLKGTDNSDRLGPIRALQSGALSLSDYRKMILCFILLSMISGIALIFTAFRSLLHTESVLMLVLGGAAILAAIKYTIGKKPYGYRGWGDIAVFLFFGWLSTFGSYFLLSHSVPALLFLPASALGLLITGVLNVNNIRDIENDSRSGKRTVPVKIGLRNARIYHGLLLLTAFTAMILFTFLQPNGLKGFLFLLTLPLFIVHFRNMWVHTGKELDPQLKFLSLSTLLFALLSGFSQIL